ncbi:uncharacterized protein LACBIDRAFT_321006 [Laccaria bicolor S238N-H82]|uniref:Predicted protein n=1 Tax=Laccaria bicolor (strain S238N-H82 / ATCC MYA-4686) TaxID=486041 RepID=B0CNG8_LACBS|nr:uncharacterized protein LACBIDRAFT_321006 [Laccaria bicolor S238N-H82]EDR15305.1 predicted protein [Laccaria bicolor S238N-H82]|eukprot:XP_001873513.1 predicted protein [Laccaria bicolor S238N-H82]
MSDVAGKGTFKPDEKHHQRGDFPVLNLGVTFGPGSQTPANLNAGSHDCAAAELLQNPHVICMATFASGERGLIVLLSKSVTTCILTASFALWFPRTYRWCKSCLDRLWERSAHLCRNFKKSIFMAPGSLILIPSAIIHSNLPVREGEFCASSTRFCAGNLFQYIDNGFWTEKQFAKEDPFGFQQMCTESN